MMLYFDFINPYIIYSAYVTITIGLIVFIFRRPEGIKQYKKPLLTIVAILLIYTQTMRYLYPIFIGTFTWQESLPFYVCRITSPVLLYYAITRDKRVEGFLYFLGGTGIWGVFIPNGPIANIGELTEYFFIDHLLLGLTSFYLIKVERYAPSYNTLVMFTFMFGVTLFLFMPLNLYLGTEYFHKRDLDIARTIFPGVSYITFGILLTIALFIFFNIYYFMAKKVIVSEQIKTAMEF